MKFTTSNKRLKTSLRVAVFFVGLIGIYTNLLPFSRVNKVEAVNAALSMTAICVGSLPGFSISYTVPDAAGGNSTNAQGRWVSYWTSSPPSTVSSGNPVNAGSGTTDITSGGYAAGNSFSVALQSVFGNPVWLTRSAISIDCSSPTITSPTKQGFTSSGASLGGNVTSVGGGSWVGRGVCVGASINPTTGCTATSGSTGSFLVAVGSLNPNTTYHYRAYAENSIGRSYTADDTFTTMANAPTGVNAVATGQTSINISWTAPVGGATSYMLSWCNRTSSPGCSPSTNIAGVTSVYSHTGLTCGTTYAYVVKSINASGNNDSSVVTATTAPCTSIPTVTLPTSTTPTSTTVTLGGTVTSNGGLAQDIRGVCYSLTSTNPNPVVGGSGVTCVNEATSNIGIFTRPVSGLTPGSSYSFVAYAHNSLGNGYTSPVSTFITSTLAPTNVVANAESGLTSYKATFNGSANPNGSQAYGYFRYFTTVPNCTVDSGGTRVPSSSTLDYDLGSGNAPRSFNFTTSTSIPLVPNTNYWYCAYARNIAAGPSSPGTSAAAGYRTFTTQDGGVSACDAPASGNLTITESCTFPQTDYDGVDAGGGGTSNTGVITLLAGGNVTILPGQVVGRGGIVTNGGSFVIANGNSGGNVRAGVWLKDADGDGVIDNPIVKIVRSTQPAGYIRRNFAYTLSTYNSATFGYASRFYNAATSAPNYLDCNSSNGNIYQNINTMVVDADGDGYKTATSGTTQCVGNTQIVNGRTYYRNAAGAYTWLSGGAALGGGATDCNDSSAAPCAPNSPSVSATGQTSLTVNWSASTGPLPTTYNLFYCDRTASSSCTPNSQLGGTLATASYVHNTGLTCGRNYAYIVRGINASGTSPDSGILTTSTSACASVPTITSPTATGITSTGATLGGNITSNGGAAITQRGICYSTIQSAPSLVNGATCFQEGGTATGLFTLATSALTSSTFYYYTIYATNIAGTGYTASNINFTTTAACTNGYIDGDGDGYGSGAPGCYSSGTIVASGGDCYDVAGGLRATNTYPGATNYFSTANGLGSYDYNCNGDTSSASERNLPSGTYSTQLTTLSTRTCTAGSAPGGMRGWVGSAPSCGATGTFRKCTVYSDSACGVFTTDPWTFTACTGSGSYIVLDRAWVGGALQCK